MKKDLILPLAVLLAALCACDDAGHRETAGDQPPRSGPAVTTATGDATLAAPNRPIAGAELNTNAGPPGSANASGFAPAPSPADLKPDPAAGARRANGGSASSPIGGDPSGAIPDPTDGADRAPVPAPTTTGAGR